MGYADEDAGGNQGRSRRWAVDSPCRSGRMRRGGTAGQETVWPDGFSFGVLVFRVWGIAHVP
jgi:hypothetical protein